MNRDFVSLFSGGGLKSIGAMQAGYRSVGAVEYDADIAAVFAENVSPLVTVAKVEDVDPAPYEGIGLLLASTVCTRASVGNANGGENEVDLAAAEGVCRWLRVARPERFLMENVVQYRAFESCKNILATLTLLGYAWTADNVNFADWGVPQSRRRLIVRASRAGGVPPLRPTHCSPADYARYTACASLFDLDDSPAPCPWNGWYSAIADLIPTLPDSQFAPWQMARLPAEMTETILHMTSNTQLANPTGTGALPCLSPSNTGLANSMHGAKAFLMRGDNAGQEWGKGYRDAEGSSASLSGSSSPKAFLCGVQGEGGELFREGGTPSPTITTAHDAAKYRALLVSDQRSHDGGQVGNPCADLPAMTTDTRPASKTRAFICEGKPANFQGDLQITEAVNPACTLTASEYKHMKRAWLDEGRVVAMTIQALARFMTVPDWYKWPEKKSLASTICGNGVPSLGVQRILEGWHSC